MSLKCSVLGHRFGETTVERDREEEGTEVVITITELETCTRCGETRVVSENKEVTTLETPDDAGEAVADAEEGDAADDEEASDIELDADADADDAEIIDDGGSEADAQAEARASQTSIPDAEGDVIDAEEEDAVIIDDQESGEWPDEDDTNEEADHDSNAEWPGEDEESVEAPDRGETPDRDEATAPGEETDESDEATDEGDDRPMGEWPEETKRSDSGGAVGVDLESDEEGSISVPEGMFKCSECGFTTEVESSSLRAGDFCPECHRGTLLQNEDATAE